jgi:hypothetical protein
MQRYDCLLNGCDNLHIGIQCFRDCTLDYINMLGVIIDE